MAKTFSYRRLEVVSGSPAADEFRERWPALLCDAEIKEEFRRITTVSLEQSFMYKLDYYSPKLVALMKTKGGVVGIKLRPHLDKIREEDDHSDFTEHILKILVIHSADGEDPVNVSIHLDGAQRSCRDVAALLKLAHFSWD